MNDKECACQCRRHRRGRFNPWVRKIPWRRAGQPTPVCLPGKPHGQRNLAVYSPWGCKESQMTDAQEERKFRSVPSLHLLSVSSTVFAMFLLNRIYCLQIGFVLCHFLIAMRQLVLQVLNPKLRYSNLNKCVCVSHSVMSDSL